MTDQYVDNSMSQRKVYGLMYRFKGRRTNDDDDDDDDDGCSGRSIIVKTC
jgi:hypothetical protein